jgi:hypothetical protein
MNNPQSFTIVLVEMLSVSLVSLLVLVLIYRLYEHRLLHIAGRITADRRIFSVFMLLLVAVPVVLLLLPRLHMTR